MASSDAPRSQHRREVTGMGVGCLFALGSTLLTCLLLFINGALVQAVYSLAAPTGPPILRNPRVSQFVLFIAPLLLVVVQWVMIDFVTSRLRRSP